VDGHDAGTDPGNVPYLDINSLLPVSTIPGGTNINSFIIDSDNSAAAGTLQLQFGSALAKVLAYDIDNAYFHFNDSVVIGGGLSATGNVDFSLSSEFHIREVADEATAACTTIKEMVLDTTENKIYVCTAVGNPGTWVSTSTAAGAYAQSIVYEPEYSDTVIEGDGVDNKGKVEVAFADTDGMPGNENYNYYIWTTRQNTLQDIDLVIRVDLPDGFTSWQAVPLTFTYKTLDNNAANNVLDITMEDTAGNIIALTGASGLVNSTWTTANVTFGGAPVFTAGEPVTIHVKLSAKDIGAAYAGRLSLNYNGT
jgi:hypothetical protein